MLEPTKQTHEAIVAAPPGFSLFVFAPTPEQKPSVNLVQEMVRTTPCPVTAFRAQGGKTEPLTVIDTPAGERYLFLPAGRIIALDDPAHTIWANFDAFSSALVMKWRISRNQPLTEPPPQKSTDT